MQEDAPVAFDLLLQVGAQHPVDESVDGLAIPPDVHVRFAQPERGLTEYTRKKSLIMHLDIPRMGAVHLDSGGIQQVSNDFFSPVGSHFFPFLSLPVNSGISPLHNSFVPKYYRRGYFTWFNPGIHLWV